MFVVLQLIGSSDCWAAIIRFQLLWLFLLILVSFPRLYMMRNLDLVRLFLLIFATFARLDFLIDQNYSRGLQRSHSRQVTDTVSAGLTWFLTIFFAMSFFRKCWQRFPFFSRKENQALSVLSSSVIRTAKNCSREVSNMRM